MPYPLQLILAFFYGATLGSFVCVATYRLPLIKNRSLKGILLGLSFPPSACPKCDHKIRWYENIPVISYLVLRGKCSSCHVKIPEDHLVMEIEFGLLFLFVWAAFVQ